MRPDIPGDTPTARCFEHLPFSAATIPLFAPNLLPYHFKLAYKELQQKSWNVKYSGGKPNGSWEREKEGEERKKKKKKGKEIKKERLEAF